MVYMPLMSLVQWAAVKTWRSLIIDPPQMGVCPPARTSATCQGNSLGRASWPLMTRWIGASWTPFPLDNPHWQGVSRKVKKTAKVKTNLKWSWCRYFATFFGGQDLTFEFSILEVYRIKRVKRIFCQNCARRWQTWEFFSQGIRPNTERILKSTHVLLKDLILWIPF